MIKVASRANFLLKYWCSSTTNVLQDWEYCQKISDSLQTNNINEALKYLIDSNLNNVILDICTFHNFFVKAHTLKCSITYSEVAYQLYRDHFKPSMIMLDQMNSLSRSNNNKIISALQQDFNYLQQRMPETGKVSEQQEDKAIRQLQKNQAFFEQQQKAQKQQQQQQLNAQINTIIKKMQVFVNPSNWKIKLKPDKNYNFLLSFKNVNGKSTKKIIIQKVDVIFQNQHQSTETDKNNNDHENK